MTKANIYLNLNPTLSQMTGKMISVWRVKLTL